MDRVLITGGAGFLGLHLARRLLGDCSRIDLIDDFSRGARDRDLEEVIAAPNVRLLELDLKVPGSLAGVGHDYTHLFHLAARVGVGRVGRAPDRTLADNAIGSLAVAALCREQRDLERLVFASSSEVYGASSEQGLAPVPTAESAPLILPDLARPRSSYVLSKLFGEAVSHHAGCRFTIVRPHNVYGPRMGQQHVIPQLLLRMSRAAPGDELVIASPNHTRTFCYIDDAVEQLVRLAVEPDALGETVNVGSPGPEITVFALAERIRRVTGKPLRLVPGRAAVGSPSRRCPDLDRLRELTALESWVELDDGLRRIATWYRAGDPENRQSA